ncbi:MAG: oligosaccharide flippase family protein [Clostridiales bacterium]|nr:oligosaccharide flippase family protein [Clostridiales bacterium]
MQSIRHSRTQNTIYNFITGIGAQFITIIMNFVCRTVFINSLGKSYLGINSLFSNILSMLSLAELGVGTAILFKLYDPLARNDQSRIKVLMKFYKQVYRIIAIVITLLGICLIPFLPNLISDYNTLSTLGLNPIFIYLLYLFNTVSSYMFFAYRSAIIKADQKEYILNIVSYLVIIIQNIFQILSLIVFKNFIIYVLIQIVAGITQNIIYAIIAQKYYPYLSEKSNEQISKEEIKDTFNDCYALLLYRINGVVLKSTDNIILSAFMGLGTVALYSNYYIFYTTINTLFTKIFESFVHSIGNLHTTKQTLHEYLIFKTSVLIASVLGGTAFIGIFVVADEFINVWIGSEWILPQPFSFLMGLELFTLSLRILLSKYRNAYGLFQQAKYRPVFSVIVNLFVSILLVNYIGICGVLIGTIIADWTTFMTFDPIILHKHGFENKFSVQSFYIQIVKNFFVVLFVGLIIKILCVNYLSGMGWISVALQICICAISVPSVLLITNRKKEETIYFIQNVIKRLNR